MKQILLILKLLLLTALVTAQNIGIVGYNSSMGIRTGPHYRIMQESTVYYETFTFVNVPIFYSIIDYKFCYRWKRTKNSSIYSGFKGICQVIVIDSWKNYWEINLYPGLVILGVEAMPFDEIKLGLGFSGETIWLSSFRPRFYMVYYL